ncbi:MAG: carboxypeptidase regulatory-like domain-containing protein [Planctomycetes bacterium]|nr:carboxypeptidase regulatory-like domain-containing protein [Planctomycetota bacterium]
MSDLVPITAVDLLLDRGASLEGIVLSETGQPIAGATIEVKNKFSYFDLIHFPGPACDAVSERVEWLKAQSRLDGTFSIEGIIASNEGERPSDLLPSHGYFVSCESPGFLIFVCGEFPVYRARRNFLKVTLRKCPEPAVVTGLVLDPDGRRVPSARVYSRAFERDADGKKSACGSGIIGTPAESNAMGEFSLTVKMSGLKFAADAVSNLMYVVAESPGYARTYVPVNVGPGTRLSGISVVLDRGSLVRGTVCDSNRRAIADARISLAEDGDSFGGVLETSSDASGQFEINGLRDVHYWAWVAAEGFIHLNAQEVIPGNLNLSFVMTPAPPSPSDDSSSGSRTGQSSPPPR